MVGPPGHPRGIEWAALTAVLDALHHPAALLSPEGRVTFVNRAQRAYLGLGPEDPAEVEPRDFVHAEDLAAFSEGMGALLTGALESTTAELRLLRHDGTYRWHLCTASLLGLSDGGQGWLVTFVEIEDHRRQALELEEALTQVDETLALVDTLQASAPIGFAFVDRDYRFQRINAHLAAIDGPSVEEHLGRKVADVVPGIWPQIEPIYARVFAGESVLDIDVTGETEATHGERHVWLASFYPVRAGVEQEVIGIGVLARDVTEERRAALQIARAQRLDAVGTLAGGVAHDFNNVLGTIALTADLLTRTRDEARLDEGLRRILAAARSASELTNRLMLFARGQPTAAPGAVDVSAAVHNVMVLLGESLGRGVEVRVEVDDAPPVLIEPTQLEQVLLNLVMNASHAMPSGGRLSVAARAVTSAGDSGDADWVVLTVADTGVGMSEEVAQRALEPFFSTRGIGEGTGLGLSAVHGIVSSAGGELTITSEPGAGTSVEVRLRRAGSRTADRSPIVLTDRPAYSGRVLVVEDQDALRDAVAETLETAGYDVVAAANGVEARIVLSEPVLPDLVLSDVVLPDVSGAELRDRLRDTHPEIPVVLMSGYTGPVLASHGVRDDQGDLGGPLLLKPFTQEALLAAVSAALRTETADRV